MEKVSYIIQNAGIVLLYPFLKTYFEHLNLLKGNDFTDQTTRFRAGQLLAYLCSGSNECLDEELLLNKILCGVAFAEPNHNKPGGRGNIQAASDYRAIQMGKT